MVGDAHPKARDRRRCDAPPRLGRYASQCRTAAAVRAARLAGRASVHVLAGPRGSQMRVGYVVLYVNDAEACRRFWVDQIGMVEKRRTEAGLFTIAQVGFADQPFAFELVPLELMKNQPGRARPRNTLDRLRCRRSRCHAHRPRGTWCAGERGRRARGHAELRIRGPRGSLVRGHGRMSTETALRRLETPGYPDGSVRAQAWHA